MYHHHKKRAGQVNPENYISKKWGPCTFNQCYGDALLGFKGLIAYINTRKKFKLR